MKVSGEKGKEEKKKVEEVEFYMLEEVPRVNTESGSEESSRKNQSPFNVNIINNILQDDSEQNETENLDPNVDLQIHFFQPSCSCCQPNFLIQPSSKLRFHF